MPASGITHSTAVDGARIAARVKELARAAGFDLARAGPATEMHVERARYLAWVAEGRQGEMRWITPERAARSADPAAGMPRARSVLSVGISYWAGHRPAEIAQSGRIARYAWGRDYHAVLGERLRRLAEELEREFGGEHRWYVDTGPMMDKALAARSGLGWYGKNTNILTTELGSFVLLGEIITSLQMDHDPPLHRDCGSCRLCLVACPTGALGPEYSIDSRKCISYLTIEHRGPIPRELRPLMGNWVFGCDICQDVCPPTMGRYLRTSQERQAWAGEVRGYLRRAEPRDGAPRYPPAQAPEGHPLFAGGLRPAVDLLWLLRLTHEEYLDAFRGTAIRRAKVWMLRRNAAVALGNVAGEEAVEPLARSLRDDEHAVVRGHAAWALGRLFLRLGRQDIQDTLQPALEREGDPDVRDEILIALAEQIPSIDSD